MRCTANGSCVECYTKKYQENREELLEYKRNHYRENTKRYSEVSRKNHEKNKERDNAYRRQYYRENKYAYIMRAIERRVDIQTVTPSWLTEEDHEKIKEIYKQRDVLSEETGTIYHVDHIIPLKGVLVCGLHCPENLQILTEEENKSKANKFEIT